MKTKIKVQARGILRLEAVNEITRVKRIVTVHNIITTLGLAAFAELVANNAWTTPFSHIALGDGSTAEAPGDTALESELIREAATVSQLVAPNDNTVRYVAMWDVGNATGTYRESGIFNDPTAGTMLNRATFSDFVVTATDALAARWDISFLNV